MPFPPTPRSLRDEASLDLHSQPTELQAIVDMLAHIQRRASNVYRLGNSAIRHLGEAQAVEDATWDGQTERRRAVSV